MKRSISRRLGTVAVALLAGLGLVATAGPAQAASMSFYKSSGRVANVDWLEVGTLPGVGGNIHFGYMYVEDLGRGQANVFGVVEDLQCPDGFIPEGPGGGHGEEPEESPCENLGARFIEGGDVTFTMDRKYTTGRLTGTLAVFGHDGPLGNPPVDMTLTGFGDTFSSTERYTYDDGTSSGSYRYSFTGRAATVSGRIGPMVFDDVAGEYSSASMGAFKNVSRDRTR